MRKHIWYLGLISLLLSGCLAQTTEQSPTETSVPLESLIAAAIAETQIAEQENFSPSPPYSPLELAGLLVPGDALDGTWEPSTVYDLTQPIPGFLCGAGYYGSCWNDWPGVADSGAELKLISGGEEMGDAVFMYYKDLDAIETIYQAIHRRWTAAKENEGESYNDIWLRYHNEADTSDLGTKSQNLIGYSLHDPDDRELLTIRIDFFRCHGYVHLELRFVPQTDWHDKDKEARLQEQADIFQIVHAYAQEIDQRITPYACSP